MGILSIFSLLLAIAFPTFLGQKSTAQATQARANVKLLVNAIESCATSRVDGTYQGSDPAVGPDCLDPAALVEYEPALGPLDLGTRSPKAGGYQVAPIGADGFGYMVQAATDSSPPLWFAELHLSDGQVLQLCDAAPLDVTDRTGGSVDDSGCSAGTW